MKAVEAKSRSLRFLAALGLAAAVVVFTGGVARAGSLTIQPSKLSRLYNLQYDGQDLRRVQSHGGLSGFWFQLDIPVGQKIAGLRYVHECPSVTSACRTATSLWRVKADDAVPLEQLFYGSYALYDQGLWIEGAPGIGADVVVRSGWRYFVYAACEDEDTMIGEIVVTWK